MPRLMFDTDEGEAVLATLRNCMENIESEIQRANNQATNLVPAHWVAEGANQFLEQAESWTGVARQSQEQLDDLCAKLRHEIDQWIEIAKMLG